MSPFTIRAFALISLISLSLSSIANASIIGTGTVTGSGALSGSVIWNDVFPGTATGIINGIQIRARVLPTLNFVVSTGILDLGNLSSAAYSTGSLTIELGTNAVNGASITARSISGGLINTTSGSTMINDLITDGIADSYRFAAAIEAAADSVVAGFAQTFPLSAGVEVNNTTTSHTIYTSNKPQSQSSGIANDDLRFYVSAKVDAQTAA